MHFSVIFTDGIYIDDLLRFQMYTCTTNSFVVLQTNNGTERIFDENIHHVGGLEMENITNAMPQNVSHELLYMFQLT